MALLKQRGIRKSIRKAEIIELNSISKNICSLYYYGLQTLRDELRRVSKISGRDCYAHCPQAGRRHGHDHERTEMEFREQYPANSGRSKGLSDSSEA